MNTPYRFNTIKTARLGDQISSELIRAITDGHYKVGDMLPSEIELARIFGRSRISVRDALKRLSSLGIITTRQGQGTVVNPTAMWNTSIRTICYPQWRCGVRPAPGNAPHHRT